MPSLRSKTYTPIGNIASTSFSGEYTYGETNYANPSAVTEIATGIATTTYSYDSNGNLTGDGTWTYNWDYKNRLATSTVTSTTSYAYDHTGQRVRKTVGSTNTFYPNKYYNVSNATTTKHIFTPSGQMIATIESNGISTTTSYIHPDHLGGTHVITNSSGQVVQTLQYYPFGKTRSNEQGTAFDEQRKFTGHEYDTESDLTYANARYYNQNIARWISQDPASRDNPSQFLQDPQQLNYYSYARNNPIILKDPTGRQYTDFNGGFAFPQCMCGPTGGFYVTPGTNDPIVYFGITFGPPGYSGSATYSPTGSPTEGWGGSVSGFTNRGVGGQVGTPQNGSTMPSSGVGVGTPGVNGSITYSIRFSELLYVLGGPFEYESTPIIYGQRNPGNIPSQSFSPGHSQTNNPSSINHSSGNSSRGGGGSGMNQISQAVISYANTPGADLTDSDFAAAIRELNEQGSPWLKPK